MIQRIVRHLKVGACAPESNRLSGWLGSRTPGCCGSYTTSVTGTRPVGARQGLLGRFEGEAGVPEITSGRPLDSSIVQSLCKIASSWGKKLRFRHRFQHGKTQRFTCGGESHWTVVLKDDKYGIEFYLIPGGSFRRGGTSATWEGER